MSRPAESSCSPVPRVTPFAEARALFAASRAARDAEPITCPPSPSCRCRPSRAAAMSARKRSTIDDAFLSSSDSPMTPDARSMASVPTSPRSDTMRGGALGLDLVLRVGDDARRIGLRLLDELGADALGVVAGLVADATGLAAGLGELRVVLLERGLGLGLSLFCALDAARDRVAARVERTVDLRHEAEEHEAQDQGERDRSPDQVGDRRDQDRGIGSVVSSACESARRVKTVSIRTPSVGGGRGYGAAGAGNGMNATPMAMKQSASVRAIPIHIRVCRRPASSGWRATDSMVLPTMMPTPIPEPMTARPKARGASCPTMFTVGVLSG